MCIFTFGKAELKTLLVHTLSAREQQILLRVGELEGRTFSAAVRALSKGCPESTAKHILRKLIACGVLDRNSGLPLVLTPLGADMAAAIGASDSGVIDSRPGSAGTKTIGIIGGLGPQTTAKVYAEIASRSRVHDNGYPHVLIDSVPMPFEVERKAVVEGRFEEGFLELLIASAKRLEAAGADLIVLPCNTACAFVDAIRGAISVPIIDLPEEVLQEVERCGLKKVGLLATPQTLRIYKAKARARKVKLVKPCATDQLKVSKVIIRAIKGETRAADRRTLLGITDRMARQGCEAVILGCTDLQLLGQGVCKVRTINSTDVLIKNVCKIIEGTNGNNL